MRKLMWFTIGFGASCAMCTYLGAPNVSLWAACFALCAALIFGLISIRIHTLRTAAMMLMGFCAAIIWYQAYDVYYLTAATGMDGTTQDAVITAADYSFETGYGLGVDGTIVLDGKNYLVRAYLDPGDSLEPGTEIKGTFRFRLTTPDGEMGASSHSGKGMFLLAYQKGELAFSQCEETTFSMWASRVRRQIADILRQSIPENAYPFAKALLLGDTTDLSYEVDTNLKVSGIRHVAAVSGLHVSILCTLLSTMMLRNRFASVSAGLPVLLLFAALAGFTPSVNRACIMCALMLIAQLLNKEYDGATSLSAAVLVMLLVNPLTISSVSFQLSVASVAGIFLFSEPVRRWIVGLLGDVKGKTLSAKGKRWIASSASVSMSAMVLTVPLCAWYFGMVSLIGILTNLLTLWVISFIFYGLMAVCAVYLISNSAAIILGKLTGVLIAYVLLVAEVLADFPLASIYTNSLYVVMWLIFVYVLLAAFLLSRKKQPKLYVLCICFGLCAALICSWAEPMLFDTTVTVLNVGQGQCILLQDKGKCYMVDCGGEDDNETADIAASELLSRGIFSLDGLILTHTDKDHAGAVENLLSRIDAELLILPPVYNTWDDGSRNVIYAQNDLQLSWGDSTLMIYGEKLEESSNENSLCILLDTEKCDILITGDRNADGEERLLRSHNIPDVDVYIAGHHGSKYANSSMLLDAISPEIVCISVGADNIYGHPAPEALLRFWQQGCQVYRTDLHGTITIRR